MIKGSGQITLVDLTEGYTIFLSSEAISLAGGTSTLGTQQDATINVTAFTGTEQITPTVGIPTCPANVSASVGQAVDMTVPVTITFAAALANSGKVTIPVTVGDMTLNKDVSFSISFKGESGGSSAYSYRLITSHAAIARTDTGYNPTSITLMSKRTLGTDGPTNYAARFVIDTTTNNTTWTNQYTSENDETTKSFTIPSGIIAIRCSLYMAGGTTTLLDQQTIPIVADGRDGSDGYTVVLSNESHTFASEDGHAVAATVDCYVMAYEGGRAIDVGIGSIATPTGMTVTVIGNYSTNTLLRIAVTSEFTTLSGILDIPVYAGVGAFSKQFGYSLAVNGENGEDALYLNITSNNGTVFKSYSESTVLTAKVYQAGVEITPSGTIKWYKNGLEAGTGSTITVNSSTISGKAVYEARLIENNTVVVINSVTVSVQQDIVSVTWYYKLVSASSAAPAKPTTMNPDGWSTTEPGYTEGSTDKLYTVKRTVFSTNTFSYSEVCLSSSFEASKDAYAKAIAAQNTADSKNATYYQTTAPTGTFKVNDLWFDTDNGNAMHYWNGTAWVQKAFGTPAIADDAITADKIYVNNLAAISANLGSITGGSLDIGSGTFVVTPQGEMTATSAVIEGDITATSGNIGGWQIVDGVMQIVGLDADNLSDELNDTINSAYATANDAYSIASGKNAVFYQASAPSGDHALNDIWYDTDDGNAMYYWDGSQWTLKEFGTTAISDSAITVDKLYVSTLSAISADLGSINAGQMDIGNGVFVVDRTGNMTATSATLVGKITANSGDIANWVIARNDANRGTTAQGGHLYNTSLYSHASDTSYEYEVGLKNDGGDNTLAMYVRRIALGGAWDGSNATNMYYVTNHGKLFARDAEITGKITASSGQIAQWNIVENDVNRGTSAQGGHIYNTGLYGHSADSTYEYETGMKTDNATGTLSFYVKRIPLGATWENVANATDMFYVRNDGKLYALNAEISGKITATSGAIGGWNILATRLEQDDVADGGYRSGMQSLTTGSSAAFYAGCTTAAGGAIVGNSAFYVTQAGKVYCSNLEVNNTNFRVNSTSLEYGDIAGYKYLSVTENGLTMMGNTLGSASVTPTTISVALLDEWAKLSRTKLEFAYLNSATGSLRYNSGTDYFGLYSDSQSQWIIGMSTSDNIWVGPTSTASLPNRIILGNTIDKIYVFNSSGGTTLLSTAVSDRRSKHDIEDLSDAHEFIMGLEPKRFKLNGEESDRYHFGFIAQDVKPILEETVGDGVLIEYNSNDTETGQYDREDEETFTYSMDYTQFIAPLVQMVQEQERRITELENIISRLKGE